jgi:3-oxoacyl-[acyl-carrier-protein] synthase II
MKRVVITGMGTVNPIGNSVNEFWEALSHGKNGIAPITKFDTSNFKTTFAGEIKNLDYSSFLSTKEARKMDDFTKYGMVSTIEAMEQANLDLETIDKTRCGVIWGSAIGGMKTFQEEIRDYYANGEVPRFNPFFIPKIIPDIVAGLIAIKYGFMGVNFASVSACASSTHSIILAFQNIQLGKADVIVAGGSEAAVTASGIGGFNSFKGLSQRNDSPETASRPFDVNRDGFVVGEGAGTLILEELEHAKRRNATILAEVKGGGMTCDAYHITTSHPEGLGAYFAFKEALREAKLSIDAIDYINTHSTSTPVGDISEMMAIKRLAEECDGPSDFLVSSTKSMTGHLLGAAGAVELIACILSMKNGLVPPTINTTNIDPKIPLEKHILLKNAQKKSVENVACLNFGFGGHNAAVICSNI